MVRITPSQAIGNQPENGTNDAEQLAPNMNARLRPFWRHMSRNDLIMPGDNHSSASISLSLSLMLMDSMSLLNDLQDKMQHHNALHLEVWLVQD